MAKYIGLLFILLIATKANSQSKSQKKLKPQKTSKGFFIGYGNSKFQIKESDWRNTTYNDSLSSINSKGLGSFSLGILLKADFNRYFSFRTKFQLFFDKSNLVYDKKGIVEKNKVEQIFFDFPLHFTLQTGRGNIMPYALFGSTIRFGPANDELENDKIQPKRFDLTGDIGVGIEYEFKKEGFVFAPEFIFSRGLVNAKGGINNLYNNVLVSLNRQSFCFVLNFRSISIKK